jgi:hypothetical protein
MSILSDDNLTNQRHVDGHYLNLPVLEPDGPLVAIVDVLKLTYATLEQVCAEELFSPFLPHCINR